MLVIGSEGMTPLNLPIIKDTPAEQALKELVEYSEKKEHWFNNPNESAEAAKQRTDPRPENGFHAPHTRHITVPVGDGNMETYHVSFTITQGKLAPKGDIEKAQDVLFRHATIAVGDMERLPNEIEAFTLSRFLGFKAGKIPWATRHPDFPAAVLLEVVSPEDEARLRGLGQQK